MKHANKRLRWPALVLAAVLGIGATADLHTPASDSAELRTPTGADADDDWELNPRRPC